MSEMGELKHDLPNTCTLYWEPNSAGGRTYYSDEIGGGVMVWDTALVSRGTILAALVQEERLVANERRRRDRE